MTKEERCREMALLACFLFILGVYVRNSPLKRKLIFNKNALTAVVSLACVEIRSKNDAAINSIHETGFYG